MKHILFVLIFLISIPCSAQPSKNYPLATIVLKDGTKYSGLISGITNYTRSQNSFHVWIGEQRLIACLVMEGGIDQRNHPRGCISAIKYVDDSKMIIVNRYGIKYMYDSCERGALETARIKYKHLFSKHGVIANSSYPRGGWIIIDQKYGEKSISHEIIDKIFFYRSIYDLKNKSVDPRLNRYFEELDK